MADPLPGLRGPRAAPQRLRHHVLVLGLVDLGERRSASQPAPLTMRPPL
jgi:hypothetical protein